MQTGLALFMRFGVLCPGFGRWVGGTRDGHFGGKGAHSGIRLIPSPFVDCGDVVMPHDCAGLGRVCSSYGAHCLDWITDL